MSDPGFDIIHDVDVLGGRIELRNGQPDDPNLGLRIVSLEDFAAVDEASAEPLLGDEETTVLSLGGMLVLYGDGGAGKTTLELDLICHLASGTSWQGLASARPCRVLIIENEGPRGMFRKKVRAKLADWKGASLLGNVFVLEDPWAVFSFARDAFLEQLRSIVTENAIDIVAAGPVNRLGIQGGGTPEEVGAFMGHIEILRTQLDRPLAVIFAHHENKAGDVSGAWEGVPDTLAHVQALGHGRTRVKWQKVRWGPKLHGTHWELTWAEGETFERLEKPEAKSDAEVEDEMIAYVYEHPLTPWRPVRDAVDGQVERLTKIRDRLLAQKLLTNQGTTTRMALVVAGWKPEQETLET